MTPRQSNVLRFRRVRRVSEQDSQGVQVEPASIEHRGSVNRFAVLASNVSGVESVVDALEFDLTREDSEHGENTDRSHDSDVAERMHDIESVMSHHTLRPRAHLPVDSEVADELRSRNIEVGSVPSASVADPLSDHEELCERGASERGREQESMQFAVVENPIPGEVQVR